MFGQRDLEQIIVIHPKFKFVTVLSLNSLLLYTAHRSATSVQALFWSWSWWCVCVCVCVCVFRVSLWGSWAKTGIRTVVEIVLIIWLALRVSGPKVFLSLAALSYCDSSPARLTHNVDSAASFKVQQAVQQEIKEQGQCTMWQRCAICNHSRSLLRESCQCALP